MADEVEKVQEQDAASAQAKFKDPYEFLAAFPGAPNKQEIESWKVQTPNGRLRVITVDGGRRAFIARAISGMELQKLQSSVPANMEPSKAEIELQMKVVSLCIPWASTTKGKLSVEDLKAGSAGLPTTLFSLISYLSDFVDPEAFSSISAEL